MTKINIVVAAQTNGAIKGLNEVTKATKRTGAAVTRAKSSMGGFNNQVSASQRGLSRFARGGLQQAGYQIGDYAVQVANGTSKMQAFGQQAPQLLQIFGPIGSIMGAAVAIFAAFKVAVDKSRQAAEAAAPKFKSMAEAAAAAGAAFSDMESTNLDEIFNTRMTPAVQKLKDQYGGLLEVMNEVAQSKRADAIAGVIENALPDSGKIQALKDAQELMTNVQVGLGSSEESRSVLAAITTQLRNHEIVSEAIRSLNASTRREAAERLAVVQAELSESGLMTDQLRDQLTTYADQAGLLGFIGTEIQNAKDASVVQRQAIIDQNTGLEYQDAIFRRLQIKVSDMGVLAREMTAEKIRYLGMLQAEDLLMSQLVLRGITYSKSNLQGGRSAGRGGPTYAELLAGDFRVQLAAQDEFIRRMTENASKAQSSVKGLANTIKTELAPEVKRMQGIGEMIGSSFESAMMSAVDGTKSFKESFKSMASEIIKELYRIFVIKRITGFIEGYFNMNQVSGSSMPLGTGNVRPVARSFDGGGYTGSGARAGGLDGKGGYMAMLHPRETVVDHTKGQGGGVTVIQNNTFGNGVNRSEINAMLPKIVEASKAAVLDARRRGGSYAGAF